MAVNDIYIDSLTSYMATLATKAYVTINNTVVEASIIKTETTNRSVKHFVYISSQTGTITRAILVDALGHELQYKTMKLTKGVDGITIVFSLSISVEESV
jgi:hypothetical protein